MEDRKLRMKIVSGSTQSKNVIDVTEISDYCKVGASFVYTVRGLPKGCRQRYGLINEMEA
jgi:hypothetical protein